MLFLLLPLFSIIVGAADNFTDCFGSCNLCDQQDMTQCSTKLAGCAPGFYYSTVNSTCILMPAFNLYANDTVNSGRVPTGWRVVGGDDTTKTMSCTTIKAQQRIGLLGPFIGESLTKVFKVARSVHTIVSLYFLRMSWGAEDKLTITIQDGTNVLRSEDITLSSFNGHNLTHINYLENCGANTKEAISGKQLSYVMAGVSGTNPLSVSLQPSLKSFGASWAITNIRVLTGCNNFMLSTEGGMCNSCPSGYYYNTTLYTCRQCHHYCRSCFSGAPDSCLSCPVMSILTDHTCKFSSNFNFQFDKLAMGETRSDISLCGNTAMLGGPSYGKIGATLSRKFQLPRHIFLKVQFTLIRVGQWQGYSLTLNVNGQQYMQITQFNEALISPLCLNEFAATLCAQTLYESNYLLHQNSSVHLEWKLNGQANPDIIYGVRSIKLTYYTCPKQCATCLLEANLGQKCETCNPFLTTSSNCLECPNGFFKQTTNETIFCQKCHVMCKNCNGEWSTNCTDCYDNFKLMNGYCEVEPGQGFVPFSKDLTKYNWVDTNFVSSASKAGTFTCGTYRLFGLAESPSPITITRNYQLLPHSGLIIMLNVFKLGRWVSPNSTIAVSLDGQVFANVTVNSSSGSSVCEGSSKDFVYTFYRYFTGHVRNEVTLVVTAGGGMGIRDINLLLKDCAQCVSSQLTYSLEYMPVYTLENTSVAINTWIKFNKQIVDPASIRDSFRISINNQSLPITETEFLYDLRLYTPLNFSFVNGTELVVADNPESVLSLPSESSIRRRLLTPISAALGRTSTTIKLMRYDLITEDTMLPIKSIHRIFEGITYFVLYPSICLVGLGLGVVLQQFTLTLQLIFMQIYVNSNELPASFKLSLEGMRRMEHLNYYTDEHRKAIEGAILPKNHHQLSPHIFEQYHTDITFIRGIYPILFLNIIYVVYYILVGVLFCAIKQLSASENMLIKWFKEIADRPFNFFDGILRWQYVTAVWVTTCQLHQFSVSPVKAFEGFNNFLTVVSIIWVGLYPFLIALYLYRVRKVILKDSFSINYEDVFYKRIKKSQDEYESFVYVTVRFLRLFLCALFTALLADQQIAAPTIVLITTVLELVYILSKEIYLDKLLLIFKILQSIGFVVLEVVYVVMWAQSDKWPSRQYMNIGFFASATVLWIMGVCLLRTAYYLYLKIKDFYKRNKKVEVNRQGRVKAVRVANTQYTGQMETNQNQTNRSIIPGSPRRSPRQQFSTHA